MATSYKGAWANGMTLIYRCMETVCVASRGRQRDGANRQHLEVCPVSGKTNCLTTVAKDNLIWQRPRGKNSGGYHTDKAPTMSANAWQENNLIMELSTKQLNPSGESNNGQQPYQQNRVYDTHHKSPAHCAGLTGGGYMVADEQQPTGRIRRLTPTECARLQTIPEWYKWECSNAQQYKMLGNGWTVEVIKHILSFLPEELLHPDDFVEAQETEQEEERKCGNCALCLHTYLGGECSLTDNAVDYEQDGCIDYIAEE